MNDVKKKIEITLSFPIFIKIECIIVVNKPYCIKISLYGILLFKKSDALAAIRPQ